MASVGVLVLCCVIWMSLLSGSMQQGPCYNYNVLTDASRSVFHVNGAYTNDRMSGWHRFMGQAGDKMLDYDPISKSNVYRCKSVAQGWLNGDHPRGSEGEVSRSVCFSLNGNNCWKSTSIKVKNCGDFYVYQLVDLYTVDSASFLNLRYCGAGEVENNFPCTNYQLLTEPNRVYTFHGKHNSECDDDLEGWYRFWGEAGHQLLNKCPSIKETRFPCGSFHQGWLNATNPLPLEGEVNRTVCFSEFYNCRCKRRVTIQMRNCGAFFVYNFQRVKDCKDNKGGRYCGIKDKNAHRVTCSPNYMRIDLDRRYYNASDYRSISLRDPRCGFTLSFDHISLGSVPSACGVIKQETANDIVYINSVKLTANFGKGIINRDHDETVNFQCSYKRDTIIDNGGSFTPVGKIQVNNTAFGDFTFHMNMFTKSNYEKLETSFPVKLKLRDWIYFEVNSTIQDKNLELFIDECYSTPTMDRKHILKYSFITSGRRTDNTVQFIPSNGVKRRFSMQAFRYENGTTVYIHCLVFLCLKGSKDGRCYQGEYGNRLLSRSRRDLSKTNAYSKNPSSVLSDYFLLDSQQVVLDTGEISKNGKGVNKEPTPFDPTIMIIISIMGVVVISLLVVLLVIAMRRKNSRENSKETKKEVGVDNASYFKSDQACEVKT